MDSIEAAARGEADVAINAISPTPDREKPAAFTKPGDLGLYCQHLSRLGSAG